MKFESLKYQKIKWNIWKKTELENAYTRTERSVKKKKLNSRIDNVIRVKRSVLLLNVFLPKQSFRKVVLLKLKNIYRKTPGKNGR